MRHTSKSVNKVQLYEYCHRNIEAEKEEAELRVSESGSGGGSECLKGSLLKINPYNYYLALTTLYYNYKAIASAIIC